MYEKLLKEREALWSDLAVVKAEVGALKKVPNRSLSAFFSVLEISHCCAAVYVRTVVYTCTSVSVYANYVREHVCVSVRVRVCA